MSDKTLSFLLNECTMSTLLRMFSEYSIQLWILCQKNTTQLWAH